MPAFLPSPTQPPWPPGISDQRTRRGVWSTACTYRRSKPPASDSRLEAGVIGVASRRRGELGPLGLDRRGDVRRQLGPVAADAALAHLGGVAAGRQAAARFGDLSHQQIIEF